MTNSPLVIWRLTDGKPGHMQQTLGLVQALSALVPCRVIDIDLAARPVGLRDFLLGRFVPGAGKEAPQLILGAGHATHWGILAARRAAGGGLTTVLMKPSLPAFLFDLVIAPAHDGLAEGPRIITTRGVLNPMRPGEKKRDSLLFLVGGPSRHAAWDDAAVLQQIDAIVATLAPGSAWRLSDSRRTPASLRAALQQRYGERFQPFAQCPSGWLATQLAEVESVWVSEDSVSMVYEALTAACRVGLLRLPGVNRSSRVALGVERLIADDRVTAFTDWSAGRPLRAAGAFNEADRVAKEVLKKILAAAVAG